MKVGVKKLLRAGMMPARTWEAVAVGMSSTERLKLRRQMAAAAGKKSTTSMSLFMEAYGIEVEEELFHRGHSVFGRRSLDRKMESRAERSLDEADSRGSNVETVMCETRDLCIKWPYWHTLIFGKDIKIDMRFV